MKKFLKENWFKVILLIIFIGFLLVYWNTQRLENKHRKYEYNRELLKNLIEKCGGGENSPCITPEYKAWKL